MLRCSRAPEKIKMSEDIERQTQEYLKSGKTIEQVPYGKSGDAQMIKLQSGTELDEQRKARFDSARASAAAKKRIL